MATEMGQSATNPVAAALNDIGIEDAQQMIDHTREAVGQALEGAADFIREKPLVCLAGAVALGYLLGKIASR